MKPSHAALILLVLLYAAFLGLWAWSGAQLPPRVATHFAFSGQANGWMTRSGNQEFMLFFGFGFPLLLVFTCWATRFLPAGSVNIPHREYWLAPARREQTSDYLVHHSLWLACLAVLLCMGIEYSVVEANKQSPPQLSTSLVLLLVGFFLAGTVLWVVTLFQHFKRAER